MEGDDASSLEDVQPQPLSSPRNGSIVLCLASGLRDGVGGGIMGSLFGFGQGLWKKEGFKGSLKDAGSSAKTFAVLSGVHTLVSCCLSKIRGKQDAINAGIAGCATGLALSTPGNPDALIRSCLTFAAFSYVLERFGRPQPATASPISGLLKNTETRFVFKDTFSFSVLPPFVLAPSYLDSHAISENSRVGRYTSIKSVSL